MHLPNEFLDPKIATGLSGAAAAVLSCCFAKVREAVTALVPAEAFAAAGKNVSNIAGRMKRILTGEGEKFVYKMGMVSALIFSAQMFNFPISHGTSGHLMGGIFAAVLLGPFGGTIALALVLIIQSFFFADGGILALGANIINMAVIGTLLGYFIYIGLKKLMPEWLAIAISAWITVVLAALACAYEMGFSGTASLSTVVPAMLKVHSVIGLGEALITLPLIKLFKTITERE
jgi:cobalt/nickel transport system permease protein